jgi:hypothetical protein
VDDGDPTDHGDDDGAAGSSVRAMRAVWLTMRDEAPPDRGLAELLAAAGQKAEAMQPRPTLWQRLIAGLRRPPVLALATAVVLVSGAVLVARQQRDAAPGAAGPRPEGDARAMQSAAGEAPGDGVGAVASPSAPGVGSQGLARVEPAGSKEVNAPASPRVPAAIAGPLAAEDRGALLPGAELDRASAADAPAATASTSAASAAMPAGPTVAEHRASGRPVAALRGGGTAPEGSAVASTAGVLALEHRGSGRPTAAEHRGSGRPVAALRGGGTAREGAAVASTPSTAGATAASTAAAPASSAGRDGPAPVMAKQYDTASAARAPRAPSPADSAVSAGTDDGGGGTGGEAGASSTTNLRGKGATGRKAGPGASAGGGERSASPTSTPTPIAELYRQCASAARRGDCATVRQVVRRLSRAERGDPARLARDPAVAKCLAE